MSGLTFFQILFFTHQTLVTVEATCIPSFLRDNCSLQQMIVFTNQLPGFFLGFFVFALFYHQPNVKNGNVCLFKELLGVKNNTFLMLKFRFHRVLKILLWSSEGQWRGLKEGSIWNSGGKFVEEVKRLELFSDCLLIAVDF